MCLNITKSFSSERKFHFIGSLNKKRKNCLFTIFQDIRKEEEENNEYAAERKIAIRTLNALILTISLILHMFGNSVRLVQRLFYNKRGQVFLLSSTLLWLIFQFRLLYTLS